MVIIVVESRTGDYYLIKGEALLVQAHTTMTKMTNILSYGLFFRIT